MGKSSFDNLERLLERYPSGVNRLYNMEETDMAAKLFVLYGWRLNCLFGMAAFY